MKPITASIPVAVALIATAITGCQPPTEPSPDDPGSIAGVIDASKSAITTELPTMARGAIATAVTDDQMQRDYPDAQLYITQARADTAADLTCRPVSIDLDDFPRIDNPAVDGPASQAQQDQALAGIDQLVRCGMAHPSHGSDVIGGIRQAAAHFPAQGRHTLVIVSDGFNNVAPADLGRNLSPAMANAQQRRAQAAGMPNLTGVKVLFVGIGADTRSRDPQDTQRLTAWWQTYLTAAGASEIRFQQPTQP